MEQQKKSRRRKAPPNTEWHGDTLYGRIRLKGKLKRWSLRTSDVDLARQIIAADIERLKAEVYSPEFSRVRYEDMFASWAERHIAHEVAGLTVKRYAVSLKQLEPFLRGKFKDEIDKALISALVDARRTAGVSTATIKRDLGALASVLDYNEVEPNVARDRLKKLKERRDPIVLPEISHIERMIARAPGCLGALVHVAWLTGCRLDELVGAERGKLDHTRRQLTVRGKRNKTSGRRPGIRRRLRRSAQAPCAPRLQMAVLARRRAALSQSFQPLRRHGPRRARARDRESQEGRTWRGGFPAIPVPRYAPSARRGLAESRTLNLRLAAAPWPRFDPNDRDLSHFPDTGGKARGDVWRATGVPKGVPGVTVFRQRVSRKSLIGERNVGFRGKSE